MIDFNEWINSAEGNQILLSLAKESALRWHGVKSLSLTVSTERQKNRRTISYTPTPRGYLYRKLSFVFTCHHHVSCLGAGDDGRCVNKKMNPINIHQHKIDKIKEFKNFYANYIILGRKETLTSQELKDIYLLREKISTIICEISHYVEVSGVATSVYYSPPPMIGGMAGNVDLFSNLFKLDDFEIPPQMVVDILNKSIGNLNYLQKQFKKNLFNPIFLVGELIRIPFHLLRFSGFNENFIEYSLFGKGYKVFASFVRGGEGDALQKFSDSL